VKGLGILATLLALLGIAVGGFNVIVSDGKSPITTARIPATLVAAYRTPVPGAEEVALGTAVDPESLIEEAKFASGAETVRVYTGRDKEKTRECLIIRFGDSEHDGGDTCWKTPFANGPVWLELSAEDATGAKTRSTLVALVDSRVARLKVVDSTGTAHVADKSGRLAFYALSPGELAAGVRLRALETESPAGVRLGITTLRTGVVPQAILQD